MNAHALDMTPAQADSIRHYIIRRANEDKALEAGRKKVAMR